MAITPMRHGGRSIRRESIHLRSWDCAQTIAAVVASSRLNDADAHLREKRLPTIEEHEVYHDRAATIFVPRLIDFRVGHGDTLNRGLREKSTPSAQSGVRMLSPSGQ